MYSVQKKEMLQIIDKCLKFTRTNRKLRLNNHAGTTNPKRSINLNETTWNNIMAYARLDTVIRLD